MCAMVLDAVREGSRENVSLEYTVLLLGGHGIEVEPIALNPDMQACCLLLLSTPPC